ncbi:hypothetical protein QFC24_000780 [Naganishia onofrii]|uniref:Uncharacterized protein n=1 Tax=Naganishia onofrii TaxID=1851511 RepID=A0ACC2XTL4_9TREE|nr:hypothetical protein QFC24_000780 [Naganishia onofrii]
MTSQIRNRSRSQIRGNSADKFDDDDKVIATTSEVVNVEYDKSAPSRSRDDSVSVRSEKGPVTAFSGISAFGLCFAVLNTWCVLVVSLGSGLATGGPSSLVWGFVYAIVCNLALTLSLGEAFAVYPTAGGQYHWSSIFSTPKYRPLISWITATTNIVGLWSGVSTQAYLASVLFQTIGVVANPDFAPTTGISYAIYLAVCIAGCVTCLLFTPRMNRWLDTGMMIMSVVGCFTLVIVIFAMSKNKASASFVFTETANSSGWDNMVIPWLLGLLQSAFSFIGVDVVFHISEEMPRADVEGPKILNMTIVIGGISGLFILLSMLFAIDDLEAILGSVYG